MSVAPLERWEEQAVAALRAAWGIPHLVVRARTASTNDDARALAEAGAAPGTVVLADSQSAGRGRRGRAWSDLPAQSVLLSMVWRPTGSAPAAAPLRAGLAVAQAVEGVTDGRASVQVKWPNDVLLGGRKLAGILCESVLGGPAPFVIVGVGLNVLQEPGSWQGPLAGTATSLRAELGSAPPRGMVAGALVRLLAGAAAHATDPLEAAERADLAARDALLDRPVSVDGTPLGNAAGIAPDGALRVRRPDGGHTLVRHGVVRPLDDAEAAR
ncbi:MAG: biotin--[acetyl-CoA-carboxylase] ligase [Gemmatimonadota bacterium]